MDSKVAPPRQLMRLRGRSYVAFVFSPFMPIVNWLEQFDATLARSSGFFVGRPIVLDLSAVDLSPHGITHLVSNLESRGIRVLGLEGVEATGLETRFPPVHSDNHLFWIQRDVSRDHG
jgi:septum site-determining protein MinC